MNPGLQDENTVEARLRTGQVQTAAPRQQRRDAQDRTLELCTEARRLDEQAWRALQASRTARSSLGRRRQGLKLDRQGLCETACKVALAVEEGEEARSALQLAQELLRQAAVLRWRVVVLHEGLARSWARRFSRGHHDHSEVAQVARVGLYEAAKRYDPDRGVRFATHAQWWIRARLMRELSGSELSHAQQEKIRNLRKLQHLHPDISAIEAAERLGWTREALQRLVELEASQVQLSLDLHPGDGADSLHEVLGAEVSEEADNMDHELLLKLLEGLPKFHRDVLTMRFGLGDSEPLTLKQIGRWFGRSRERIRQIERAGLQMLRDRLTLRFFDRDADDNENAAHSRMETT